MNKQDILNKIKKCLALGQSTSKAEADTAIRQAQKMMEKYNINEQELEYLDICEQDIKGSGSKNVTAYEMLLAVRVAEMMDCIVLLTHCVVSTKYNVKVVGKWNFVGFDPAPELASYTFDVLFRQLKKARKEYMETQLKFVRLSKNKTKRADAFCEGWVAYATRSITKKQNESKIDKINQYITDKKGELDSMKSRKAQQSVDDFIAGAVQGKNVKINSAVYGKQQLQITD